MTEEQTVGALAAERPASVKVFHRHGIDFCCGGGISLERACEKRGLDVALLQREIDDEEKRGAGEATNWQERPLDELIDHIVANYHRPLEEELPRLEGLARKVTAVHGDRHPELAALLDTYVELALDLAPHMMREERILFPAILGGDRDYLPNPVETSQLEHETSGELLARIRNLTGRFALPTDACGSFRALWQGLEDLERSLFEHIHLENNILFPRALRE